MTTSIKTSPALGDRPPGRPLGDGCPTGDVAREAREQPSAQPPPPRAPHPNQPMGARLFGARAGKWRGLVPLQPIGSLELQIFIPMNSERLISENRNSFNNKANSATMTRQPSRVLVVDVTPPFWSDICSNLCEVLENFFALACSLGGLCRLPLFSLYVVHNQQECLLPFLQVKGNFPKLQSCISELRSMPKEGCLREKPGSLKHAVEDGLLQFKQYMRHVTIGGSLNSCSVEITVLTTQPGKQVVKQLESGLSETDLVSVRRLQVLQVSSSNAMELMDMPCSTQSILSGEVNNSDECSILGTDIDLQIIGNDTVSLDSFFKSWLHNHETDKEHLHLLLADMRLPTCLKCDVQERLISPALLPGPIDFTEKTESLKDIQKINKAANSGSLQYKLQVIKALKSDGVCESVFYGLPLIITPTNCWKLDWDELETNHQNFHALCHTLKKRDWMLLARSEPQVMRTTWSVHVDSYYIILPSTTLSLLVKPVAVQELLLPCDLPYRFDDPPETALSKMEEILDGLDVESTFNPLSLKSNLYKHLRGTLVRSPYRQQPKQVQRREQHHPEQLHRQQNRPNQNKMKAAVAPLPLVHQPANQPKNLRPTLSVSTCSYRTASFSDEEEFLSGS
ncbi:meiosis 1 arrest protein [Pristis pectinata]|uniref:meiosis 1 arrest protein n=1 Tax=Pristis pectinata TaxID=685728 RepID=UPI00223CA014|nr:meiosis 1 arrest protein [Pristis pectinata]